MVSYDFASGPAREMTGSLSISSQLKARWTPPRDGWVKMNGDGSFLVDGSAGVAMVLRDRKGSIIFSSCRQLFNSCDALETELCAAMEGLSLALQRCEAPIEVELDSLTVVQMIQSRAEDRSVHSSIVKEIKYLLSLRESCIIHIRRSQNNVSDCLAKFARIEDRTMTWIGSGRPSALEHVLANCKYLNVE